MHEALQPSERFFSGQTTEEELTMLRLRLAYLALASGCTDDLFGLLLLRREAGGRFPGLFRSKRYMSEGECGCEHAAHMPSTFRRAAGAGARSWGPMPGPTAGPIMNPGPRTCRRS